MAYVAPTGQIAKYAGSQHTPGTLDKVFNTTFGIIQQPLWRVWRALKEEDIDVFSKQGLLDPALLPILGAVFDNKNTVMADELFGDHMGAQIAGSILTDPLSFATSGLSALGRTGKALSKAVSGTGKNTKAFHEAAHYGAGNLDQIGNVKLGLAAEDALKAGDTTVNQMLAGIQHAQKNGGFIDEAGNMMGKGLKGSEIKELGKLSKRLAGLPENVRAGTLASLMAKSKKREMGLTLPFLDLLMPSMYTTAPLRWSGLDKHGGWMKWYGSVLKNVYVKPAKLALHVTDPVVSKVWGLNRMSSETRRVVSHFGKGWQEGSIPRAVAKYVTSGARPLVNASDGSKVSTSLASKVYDSAYITNEQGRKLSLTQNNVEMEKHVDILTQELELSAKEANISFRDAARRRFGKDGLDTFFTHYEGMSKDDSLAAFKAQLSTFLTQKELGVLSQDIGLLDIKTNRAAPDVAKSFWYHKGRNLKTFFNKALKNDLGINGGEILKTFSRRQEAVHTQAQEAMAYKLYALRDEVVRQTGKSADAINQLMYARLSLTASPEEVNHFISFLDSSSVTMKQWADEFNDFLGGRVSGNVDLLKATVAENMVGGTNKMMELLDGLMVPVVRVDEEIMKAADEVDKAALNHLRLGGRLPAEHKEMLLTKYGLEDGKTLFTRMHSGELNIGKIAGWEKSVRVGDAVGGVDVVTYAKSEMDPRYLTFASRTWYKSAIGGKAPLVAQDEAGNLTGKAMSSIQPNHLFGEAGTKQTGIFGEIGRGKTALQKFFDNNKLRELDPDAPSNYKGKYHHLLPANSTVEDMREALHALDADSDALTKLRGIIETEADYKVIRPDLTDATRFVPSMTKTVNALGEYSNGKAITLESVGRALGDQAKDVRDLARTWLL